MKTIFKLKNLSYFDLKNQPGDTVVVRLADASDGADARLDEEVLSEIGDALFGDEQVGLELDDVVADALDVLLLELKNATVFFCERMR